MKRYLQSRARRCLPTNRLHRTRDLQDAVLQHLPGRRVVPCLPNSCSKILTLPLLPDSAGTAIRHPQARIRSRLHELIDGGFMPNSVISLSDLRLLSPLERDQIIPLRTLRDRAARNQRLKMYESDRLSDLRTSRPWRRYFSGTKLRLGDGSQSPKNGWPAGSRTRCSLPPRHTGGRADADPSSRTICILNTGASEAMKGKRKAKTTKWGLEQQLRTEAQCLLAGRSLRTQQRFLVAASTFDIEHEPVGTLAGLSLMPHRARSRI